MSKHKTKVDVNGTEIKIKSEDKKLVQKVEQLIKTNAKDLNPKESKDQLTLDPKYLKG